jgi:hypothetical protein
VSGFDLRGIDVPLDPTDTQAFVTGLNFAGSGTVQLTQTPVTVNTDVPEPGVTMLLGLGGLAGFAARRFGRKGKAGA